MIARHPSSLPYVDPVESAKLSGLRYVSDATPGFTRQRFGRGFAFLDTRQRSITDEVTLRRIKSLAIPPAWTDVWICPLANGHLQATGRDARGRKQHRYHPKWREARDETKYARMIMFAKALPKIRKRVAKDSKLHGLPRAKVLATVVKLLELSLIRVGNEEYAHSNNSYGLTTMQDRHVKVNGSKVRFTFKGKSGKNHSVDVENPALAKTVKKCQDLPGQELFQYLDESGRQQDVKSEDVNEYLRGIAGSEFTAKDFRTWAGTVLAAMALSEFRKFDSKAQAKKNIVQAIETVAARLGNTPSVCRKCYVHPAVINSYLDSGTIDVVRQRAEQEIRSGLTRLRPEEASVLTLLQQRVKAEKTGTLLRTQLSASLKARKRKTR